MVIRINEYVTDDYKYWASLHGIEIVNIKGFNFARINDKCSKLRNGRCTIHDNKPNLCKKFDCEDKNYDDFKVLL